MRTGLAIHTVIYIIGVIEGPPPPPQSGVLLRSHITDPGPVTELRTGRRDPPHRPPTDRLTVCGGIISQIHVRTGPVLFYHTPAPLYGQNIYYVLL